MGKSEPSEEWEEEQPRFMEQPVCMRVPSQERWWAWHSLSLVAGCGEAERPSHRAVPILGGSWTLVGGAQRS
jgi:hypothetical protein